ncbi:MAG: hypothetical protein M1815_001121 [Lichina confinis]|nr:MAG: hypothetical protein M1815_001121 [Lichina confinis]
MFGAFRQSARRLARSENSATLETKSAGSTALKREAKKNPELYVGALNLGALDADKREARLTIRPTSTTSQEKVEIAPNSMPWQRGHEDSEQVSKYKYHPGGNKKAAPMDAPSALNSVVIGPITMPKRLHDRFNKYGKDDW